MELTLLDLWVLEIKKMIVYLLEVREFIIIRWWELNLYIIKKFIKKHVRNRHLILQVLNNNRYRLSYFNQKIFLETRANKKIKRTINNYIEKRTFII